MPKFTHPSQSSTKSGLQKIFSLIRQFRVLMLSGKLNTLPPYRFILGPKTKSLNLPPPNIYSGQRLLSKGMCSNCHESTTKLFGEPDPLPFFTEDCPNNQDVFGKRLLWVLRFASCDLLYQISWSSINSHHFVCPSTVDPLI